MGPTTTSTWEQIVAVLETIRRRFSESNVAMEGVGLEALQRFLLRFLLHLGKEDPMYLPPHFEEGQHARVAALVEANPLATVVCVDEDGAPEISHLPCLMEPGPAGEPMRVLLHVAQGNALTQWAFAGRRMTAVFHGPHCYISPRLFKDPSRQVPTWNYAVVHLSGPTRVMSGAQLRQLLERLSTRFEAAQPAPWHPNATQPGFVDPLLMGIMGIVMDVDRVEAKFKLNQNRSLEDRRDVQRGLALGREDERAVAALMAATL